MIYFLTLGMIEHVCSCGHKSQSYTFLLFVLFCICVVFHNKNVQTPQFGCCVTNGFKGVKSGGRTSKYLADCRHPGEWRGCWDSDGFNGMG